jgi:hypothetical protein
LAGGPGGCIRSDGPFGGYCAPVVPDTLAGVMIVLEISVIALSVVAFVLFDLYTRACDRI